MELPTSPRGTPSATQEAYPVQNDCPPLPADQSPTPPLPPPLPPSPGDSEEAAAPPPPTQLAELFRAHKAVQACQYLQELSTRDATREVKAAFQQVEWAPSAFLMALEQYPSTAPRNVFYASIAVAVECMKQRLEQAADHAQPPLPPSPMVSTMAGSLLLNAFEDARPSMIGLFVGAFHVAHADVQKYCIRLVSSNLSHVVTVLHTLALQHLLPLQVVLDAALRQNDLHAADLFVRDNRDYQLAYVGAMIAYKVADKLIKKRMDNFQISDFAFPEFQERRMRASLRFLVHTQAYEEVLSMIRWNTDLALYASRFVLSQRGDHDPVARLFVYRAGMGACFPHIDISGLATATFPDKDELEPLATCLSLIDLVGEDNCVFVNTPEALAQCVAHLQDAPVVGFDCEWKTATHRSQKPAAACAVVQLASSTRAFVVDMIALGPHSAPLVGIFRSETILKLGFDAKGDTTVLAKVLPLETHERETLMSNLVDIQALAKRLRRAKRPRLQSGDDSTTTTEHASTAVDEIEDGEIVEDGEITAELKEGDSRGGQAGHDEAALEQQQELDAVVQVVDDVVTTTVAQESGEADASSRDAIREARSARKKAKKDAKRNRRGDHSLDRGSQLSLTAVAEAYLGKPLDKRTRMSDWERRPLTKAQLHYAALDAYVLVAILEAMKQQIPEDELNEALAQTTQTHGQVLEKKAQEQEAKAPRERQRRRRDRSRSRSTTDTVEVTPVPKSVVDCTAAPNEAG